MTAFQQFQPSTFATRWCFLQSHTFKWSALLYQLVSSLFSYSLLYAQMPDSCQMSLSLENVPGTAMSLATLILAGCPSGPHLASVNAMAATLQGSRPLPLETITTTFAVTITRATARALAVRGAQNLALSAARDYHWPTVTLSAPSVEEIATGTWAITTVTFWTARWRQHPMTRSAAQASDGASKRRKGERARAHLRSYHWRGQEGTTRPRPASRCHAVRSTCDSLATVQSSPPNTLF